MVYASLYSYSRDMQVLRAFRKSWCPTTSTLHTISGEMSIPLRDLHRLGGLPVSGKIYDETVHSLQAFEHRGQVESEDYAIFLQILVSCL